MNNNPIKFAIAGCGHIGKRHAEMISRNPQSTVVAMADLLSKENLDIENTHPDTPLFHSIDEMLLEVPDIEVVVIATPNGLHAKHALKCLNAYKHVVIEKPLALCKADAEKIIYRALHVNRNVFSVMQNRYSPPSAWLKQMVDNGTLGKIYMVQINCYWNRDDRYYKPNNWHGSMELDGGTLYTQFSHFLDIMFWLFGDIKHIQSRLGCFNHSHLTQFEDSGIITFEFCDGGGMGSFNFSTSVFDKNLESSITIIAEKGSIKVGGQYMNEVEYCHVKNYTMPVLAPTSPANDYGAFKGSAANHNYVVENVVNVLRNNATITTNAMEGFKVVEIIEQMYGMENGAPSSIDNNWRTKNNNTTSKELLPQQVVKKRKELMQLMGLL
jgi:UDP-N-acetyl-2-amino-2-deoxyglucuronate dehydrogenase